MANSKVLKWLSWEGRYLPEIEHFGHFYLDTIKHLLTLNWIIWKANVYSYRSVTAVFWCWPVKSYISFKHLKLHLTKLLSLASPSRTLAPLSAVRLSSDSSIVHSHLPITIRRIFAKVRAINSLPVKGTSRHKHMVARRHRRWRQSSAASEKITTGALLLTDTHSFHCNDHDGPDTEK